MASQILFNSIINDYYMSVSGSNVIVPPGSNANDYNIRIIAIVPSSVDALSAVTGNIVNVNGTTGSFTNQLTTLQLTSSNCASSKLVITQ